MATPAKKTSARKRASKNVQAEEEILAGFHDMGVTSWHRSAGVRLPGGGTLSSLQRFRGNYDALGLKNKFKVARWLAEYNWFVAPVIALRRSVIMDGFSFKGQPAREWVKVNPDVRGQQPQVNYPWKRIVRDIVDELLTTENVVVVWRKNVEFPMIDIFDAEAVDYRCRCGQEMISLNYQKISKSKSPDKDTMSLLGAKYGAEWLDRFKNGGTKTIVQDVDEEFQFMVMSRGRRREELKPPSVLSIADDLDFVEMVKVGDWNGAFARKKLILHLTKGTKISSADRQVLKAMNATGPQIRALKEKVEGITGVGSISSNHDVAMDWEYLSSEFFGR